MKKLCFSLDSNPFYLGGVETFERNLKKIFKDLKIFAVKRKEKKYFIVDDVIELDNKNIKFRILRKLFGKERIIRKILKDIGYDILICNSPRDLRYSKKDCNLILVQHWNFEIYKERIFINREFLINEIRDKVKYFIFLSEYDKERFIKEINFPREKSIVIRHTCEIELLKNKKEKNRNLIMICRLDNNHKRIDLSINAMKKLQDFKLNIYGDGEDKKYLETLIKENNLKNVFLHGGTNQVKEKLDENGIFIMTSDFEGYGITNIEAMRRGLPIILRNTFDAAQDIAQDNGVLLEKEWDEDKFVEAVREVYDNYEYYSENSLKMGKRHDFEVIKKEWDKLFESIN